MSRTKISIVIKVAALIFYFLLAFFLAKGQVVSNFEVTANGADGWTSPAASGGTITYNSSGGNPGGFVVATDAVSAGPPIYWTFVAPNKFLGNVSSLYNHTITFDLNQSTSRTAVANADVFLSNGVTNLYYYSISPTYPATSPSWTSYSVTVNELSGNWKTSNSATGTAATKDQIKSVLLNLTSFQIRGRFGNSPLSSGSLDNVVMNVIPPPTPPTISSFSPSSGLSGTTVTVLGNNFNSTASQNVVYFNGIKGSVVNATATQLTVTSPPRISNGPITVLNLANGTQGVSNQNFNPLFNNNQDFGGQIIPASFGQKTDFGASAEVGMSVGDLDGDGWTDVLTSGNGLKASVFLNLKQSGSVSSTSFAAPLILSMPNSPANGVIRRVGQNSIADIDSDGKLDLIINVGYGNLDQDNGMVVFVNQSTPGNLSFASGTVIEFNTINDNNGGMTIADIDGDGRPEFLGTLINSGCHLGIAQNLSTPGNVDFAAVQDFALGATMGNFISVGDLTGDGKPEIIVEAYLGGTLSVYENLSTIGTIAMASPITISTLVPSNVQVVDLDNDGKADLFYKDVSVASNLHLRKNNHISGALTVADFSADIIISNSFNAGANSAYVGSADINGDNKLDIIGNDGTNVFVYPNNNSGALSATSFLTGVGLKGAESSNAYVFFADVDGDNKPEILVKPQSVANFRVYHNESFPVPIINNASPSSGINGASVSLNGNLMFTANSNPSLRFNKISTAISGSPTNTLTATTNPLGSISGKITITNHGLTSFSPYFNTAFYTSRVITSSSFGPSIDFALGINLRDALEIADFDDDGKSDVAVVDNFSTAKVFQNTNTVAQSISATSLALQPITYAGGFNMLTLDIDGDGKVDLNSGADLFQNTSSGAISFAVGTSSAATGFNRAVFSDFNKDGKLDIATNNSGTNIQVIENRSTKGAFVINGNFSPYSSTAINFTKGNGLGGIVAEDFDGDGYVDMISSNQVANNLTYYLNTKQLGVITTASFSLFGNVSTSGSQPSGITANDFDGDGKIDIAVSFFNSAFVSVYLNNSTVGNISFAASVDVTSANKGYNLASQDLDGDGKAEIVVIHQPNPGPGSFTIFQNKSSSGVLSFGTGVNIGLTRNPQGINFADINSDQKPDILIVANGGTGNALMVFENKISTPPSPPTITSFTPASGLAGSSVTITGTGFNTTITNNTIYFDGIKGTVTSATATQLVVTVPPYARYGSLNVLNLGNNLSASSSANFTPLFNNNKDFGGRIIPSAMSLPINLTLSTNISGDGKSVSVADVDADGFPDLLVSQSGVDSLTFFRNKGIGDLSSAGFVKTQLYIPYAPDKPIAKDIDGDGKLDLVVKKSSTGNNYQIVSIYLNIGSPGSITSSSFAASFDLTLPILVGSSNFAVADLDLDGKPDLLLQSSYSVQKVVVYRNTSVPGSISFDSPFDVLSNASLGITVGDIDGDGKPDIVATGGFYGTAGFTITQNTSSPGSLSFGTPVLFAPPSGPAFDYISLADLDNDGKPDISFEGGGGAGIVLYVMKNKATAGVINTSSLATEILYPWATGTITNANRAHVADINGDGKPEVIGTGSYSGNNTMLISQNVGQAGVIDATTFLNGVPFGDGNVNVSPNYTTSGDLDGDGKPEVIAANGSYSLHYISIYKNITYPAPRVNALKSGATTIQSAGVGASISTLGDFQFTNSQTPLVRFGTTTSPVSSPTNTSVTTTVPTSTSAERVAITLHSLTGFSPLPFNTTFPTSGALDATTFATKVDFALTTSASAGVVASDFDNDGKTDVIVGDFGNIKLFRNSMTSSGSVTTSSLTSLTPINFGIGAGTLATGDFDGDGLIDFKTGSNLFRNNSGSQAEPISFETGVNALSGVDANNLGRAKTNIDFNRDGKADMVSIIGSPSPAAVVVSENLTRKGSFSTANPFLPFGSAVTAYTTAGTFGEASAGDFDGDGYDDIVFLNTSGNQLQYLLNTQLNKTITVAQFGAPQSIATLAAPKYITIQDFNLDGKLDVAVAYTSIATVSVFTNTSTAGNISFTKQDFTSLANTNRIDAADLDGDGKAEIVTIHGSTAPFNFSILKNTSTSSISFASKIDYALATQPVGLAVADINLDSKPDILITRTGQFLSVFQNQLASSSITITSQPISIYSVCDGATPAISATATGTTNITYQWQYSPDGIASYTDLTNTGGYSNVSTSSFAINSTGNFGAGFYRCKINGDFAPTVYSNTVSFTVNALPSAPVTSNVSNCGPGSVVLAASGTTNGNYFWYDTNGLITGQNDSTYTTPVISSTSSYSVAITDGTCVSFKATITATINTVPATPTASNVSNCGPASITLTASGGSNGNYLWYDTLGVISGQVNSSYITPVITSTTTYSVAITNGGCNSVKLIVTATINAIPIAPGTQDATQCTGSTFLLTASGGINGQYIWYTTPSGGSAIPGEANSTYTTPALINNTIYYVSINDGICESARSPVTATVNTSGCSIPVITSTSIATQVGGTVSLNLVPLITTINNNLNVSSIIVTQQPASGAIASVSNGVLTVNYNGITFSGSEQITVQACDADGNCATQVFTINVAGDIVIYNGISPNGKNPAFIIDFIDLLPETKLNTVTIFDRWENLVWHGTNYDNSSVVFTGTSDGGSDLPSGVYYYKINFSSGRKTETGFLSLRRQ